MPHSPLVRIGYRFAVWLVLAVLAVLNGGFRELVLVSVLGPDTAHLLSTVLLVGLILVVSFLFFRWSDIGQPKRVAGYRYRMDRVDSRI